MAEEKKEKQSGADLQAVVAEHTDFNSAFVCNHEGKAMLSTFATAVSHDEIKHLLTLFDDRDTTISRGFYIAGQHFEVHIFTPPLVYGRRGRPDYEDGGLGFAAIRAVNPKNEKSFFMAVTFPGVTTSAFVVPQLRNLAKTTLETL